MHCSTAFKSESTLNDLKTFFTVPYFFREKIKKIAILSSFETIDYSCSFPNKLTEAELRSCLILNFKFNFYLYSINEKTRSTICPPSFSTISRISSDVGSNT